MEQRHEARVCSYPDCLLLFQPNAVQAQSAPSCSFQPDGSIVCITGGGNNGGGDEGGGNGGRVERVCTPGEHLVYHVTEYDAATSTGSVFSDHC